MDGILIIDKPSGCTSRDVVNKISKILSTKHIGHTGTLDPLATGVLVLAVNKGTKLIEFLSADEKEYIVTVETGYLTDTLDVTGTIIETKESPNLIKEELEKVLKSFIKVYDQEVPLYSAVHVNGKRLYEYAREKKEVILPKKEVEIKDIKLLSIDEKTFTFSCTVSKGTYIRSLIRDIALEMNHLFVLKELRRTREGIFKIENALTIEEFDNNKQLLPLISALDNYTKIVVDDITAFKVKNGQKLKSILEGKYGILLDKDRNLLAIYEQDKDGFMKAKRVF